MKRWFGATTIVALIILSVYVFQSSLTGALYPAVEDLDVPVTANATTTNTSSRSALAVRPKTQTFGTISIPSIKVTAGIEKVAVNAKGNISSPTTFQTVGWYTGSAKLGEPGMAIMDGHVNNGLGLSGVFTNLESVAVGDDIYIEQPNTARLHFQVEKVFLLDYSAHLEDITKNQGTDSQLVLVTCTGDWIASQKTYDKRLVVLARKI